jgi:glycerate dehydrogenase
MKETIIITDGHTLNPGDLTWKPFEELGAVKIYDFTPEDLVLQRCQGATIIVTNKTPISKGIISACPNLKIIAVTATGYDVVDIQSANTRGVQVCNVPGYGTDSVAQHTFSLILELTNHVGLNSQSVRKGDWSSQDEFCYTKAPIRELRGKTLGVVGYGKIGRRVGDIGSAFGMNILYSASPQSNDPHAKPVEQLFFEADIVSLHCPLTKDNRGFVNYSLLSSMKRSSLLINTARGQLINENDLLKALKEGLISGAALDVLSKEPPPADHPLLDLSNCIITPHNAWYSFEARSRIMEITVRNIDRALKGSSQNLVKG